MATLTANSSKVGRVHVPTSAIAKSVEFSDEMMSVHLADGRVISVPLTWFPLLRDASPAERAQYEMVAAVTVCIGPNWTKTYQSRA